MNKTTIVLLFLALTLTTGCARYALSQDGNVRLDTWTGDLCNRWSCPQTDD